MDSNGKIGGENLMFIERIKKDIEESAAVKNLILNDTPTIGLINEIAEECINTLNKGGKVIFCGNGGSFADAQHLSAEFTGKYAFDRGALASIALGTNSSSLSAIGNDYGYENVFSREIEAVAKSEDILIGITTSGNSKNILKAVEVAKSMNITTYIFTGNSGGEIQSKVKCLNVPSEITARIQECHIMIGQIICGIVEAELFKES